MKASFYKKSGFEKKISNTKFNRTYIEQNPPAGSVVCFAASGSTPTGWLLCDGTAVSRTTYADLFAVAGTTYGSGDGSTTFNLPDLRGKTAIGAGQGYGVGLSGSGLIGGVTTMSNIALGATGGVNSVTLTGAQTGTPSHTHTYSESAHTHTFNESDHTHTISYGAVTSITGSYNWNNLDANSATNVATSSNDYQFALLTTIPTASGANVSSAVSVTSASATASSAHTNIQPSMVLNYIIKT